jgi:proton-dependent oligopeptide transporter, POT family
LKFGNNMAGDTPSDAVAGSQVKAAEHEHRDEAAAESPPAFENPDEKHTLNTVEGLVDFPSDEDLFTLRRVSDRIPPKLFTIAFIELCERFSYYGAIIVVCSLESTIPLFVPY